MSFKKFQKVSFFIKVEKEKRSYEVARSECEIDRERIYFWHCVVFRIEELDECCLA